MDRFHLIPLDTVGSCSMLPLSDGGVVDPNLKGSYTIQVNHYRSLLMTNAGLSYEQHPGGRSLRRAFAYSKSHSMWVVLHCET